MKYVFFIFIFFIILQGCNDNIVENENNFYSRRIVYSTNESNGITDFFVIPKSGKYQIKAIINSQVYEDLFVLFYLKIKIENFFSCSEKASSGVEYCENVFYFEKGKELILQFDYDFIDGYLVAPFPFIELEIKYIK